MLKPTCPECGTLMAFADDVAGRSVRCPDCRAVVRPVDVPTVLPVGPPDDVPTVLPAGPPAWDAALISAIMANPAGYYVNFHSAAHGSGVIRGQLTKA